MVTNSAIAAIPIPERTDRVDGPAAFSAMNRRLEDITVVAYASTTARASAYTAAGRTPTHGTTSFLRDTSTYEYWSGSAWVPLLPQNWAKGVIAHAWSNATLPASGYLTTATAGVNVFQMLPDVSFIVPLVAGRLYRWQNYCSMIDAGPGSSTTSGGATFSVKYTTNGTTPITTSATFMYTRVMTINDAYGITGYGTRVWVCTATGNYGFQQVLETTNTGGVRATGERHLICEDLGIMK